MSIPNLPAQGSTSWYPWAQGLHDEVTTGRLSDSALKAAYVAVDAIVINVKDHGAKGDGSTDDTAAIQVAANAAASSAGEIFFPAGNYKITAPITLATGAALRGLAQNSIITATHAGAAFTSATPGVRSYTWTLTGLKLLGPGATTAGSVGIDLDSVSSASIRDVSVSGFETGIRVRSAINGGATYNRFFNVTAGPCGTGVSVAASGSNGTQFVSSRFTNCTNRGLSVVDSNECILVGCEVEENGVGVYVNATSDALADGVSLIACRFEGNNTAAWQVASANVRDMAVLWPRIFGTYTVVDNGTRTTHVGQTYSATQRWSSAWQDANGSFLFERANNGGTELPAFVVRDADNNTGTPVTVLAQTARIGGYFYRGQRAGTTYFDVRADGVVWGGAYATASRPSAAGVRKGGQIFDTTLNKPLWSDGTAWRDAAGTVV